MNGFTQLSIHHPTEGLTLSISINRNNAPRGPVALALISALEEALTVSVPESSNVEMFRVYPNPAGDIISIEFKSIEKAGTTSEISIHNSFGSEIYREKVFIHFDSIQIDTSYFISGVYFLTVRNEKHSCTQKLLIN